MSEAGRNSGEIRNRAQKYWESENLYHDKIVDITFPEAILNKPDLDGFSAKTVAAPDRAKPRIAMIGKAFFIAISLGTIDFAFLL